MLQYVLYSTEGCHLCEMAFTLIHEQTGNVPEIIEIAYEDRLMEKYGMTIPVLAHRASGAELGWPFEKEQLQVFLENCEKLEPK